MGKNKALMDFLGIPLIQRVVDRVAVIEDEINIIANEETDYQFLNFPVFPDRIPGKGVLGGIYTALLVSGYPFVSPVGCDMPFVSSKLLSAELKMIMDTDEDVVIPSSVNSLEPLHAVYRKSTCLPKVESALARGDRRIISWFDEVKVRVLSLAEVTQIDPDPHIFLNINSPEEFERALEIAKQQGGI